MGFLLTLENNNIFTPFYCFLPLSALFTGSGNFFVSRGTFCSISLQNVVHFVQSPIGGENMFSENLKKARIRKNLTPLEVAQALSITRRSYYFFESGERSPSLRMLAALSVLLDVSTDQLLCDEKAEFLNCSM